MKTRRPKPLPDPCAEWAEQLAAGHPDDLTPGDQALLKSHIASCPNCAAVYAEYQEVNARILSLPAVQPSAQQVSRLEALITDQVHDESRWKPLTDSREPLPSPIRLQTRRRRAEGWLSSMAAVLMVAVLAGGALLLFSSRHPSSSTLGGKTGTVYTVSYSDGTVYALDAVTGKINWRTPLHIKPDEAFLISHGMIFVTSQDGFLYAVKASDGHLLWKHSYQAISRVNGRPVISPSLVSDGNAIYLGAGSGIYAWRVRDGQQLWRHLPPANCDQKTATVTCNIYPIATSNGIVYVYFDGLYALRSTDGATLWYNQRFQPGEDLVVIKNQLYVASYNDATVYVLRIDNGRPLDTIRLPHNYPIQILAAGEMVYIMSGLYDVYAVRSSDERILWQKHYTVGGRLVAAANGNLYYISLPDLNPNSTQHSGSPKIVCSTPIALSHKESGFCYEIVNTKDIGSLVVRVYALNASNGSFHWYWQSPKGAPPDFVATTGQGMVYVVLSSGLYALRASDSTLVWHALANTWLTPPTFE